MPNSAPTLQVQLSISVRFAYADGCHAIVAHTRIAMSYFNANISEGVASRGGRPLCIECGNGSIGQRCLVSFTVNFYTLCYKTLKSTFLAIAYDKKLLCEDPRTNLVVKESING